MQLPITQIQNQIISLVRENKRLVLSAPTGSGKSTQIPQMLLDSQLLGDGQVTILQPRRLATRMLASWVAHSRKCQIGEEVGYQIRFENRVSPATKIRYVTEGVLLRQIVSDPLLTGISAVIFDEFHERHLFGDITLARVLQVQATERPDLIIVVMSATLDVKPLTEYLRPCAVLTSEGRTFPVTIEYLKKSIQTSSRFDERRATPRDIPIWDIAATELETLMYKHTEGDVLVFMPGAYEINRTVQAMRDTFGNQFLVFPLHGDLLTSDQDAAVQRYDKRKIIVSTNVAETSLTIEGVRLVIDCGLARISKYDPNRGINTLLIEKISRAAADQRSGRAGRTAPGHCLRLWTEKEHESRRAQELPEIKRLDLAEVVLMLKAAGVENVDGYRWFDPPDPSTLAQAISLLKDLGALNHSNGAITDTGKRMLAFPLHPRFARMLLAAGEYGCVRPIALIAALTQGRDLLLRNIGRSVEVAREELLGGETDSDFFVLMRAWRYAARNDFRLNACSRFGIHAQTARQVGPLFEQFLKIAQKEGLDINERPTEREHVQRCILLGFSDHVARRRDEGTLRCDLIRGRTGLLARESVVSSPLLVATEVAEIEGKKLNVILRFATAIRTEWLEELYPEDIVRKTEPIFDTTHRRVIVSHQERFRDLVLNLKNTDSPANEAAATVLAREVVEGRCVLNHWNEAVEQWFLRVHCLWQRMPELNFPEIGEETKMDLITQICLGASTYKEIKDRPVLPTIRALLNLKQQKALDQFAPERINLPGAVSSNKKPRNAKVLYSLTNPPMVSARIQDLFDVTETLQIAQGRINLQIQILAPNNRPVQVTENLSNFWKEIYPKLKLELQRKYPKHEWR